MRKIFIFILSLLSLQLLAQDDELTVKLRKYREKQTKDFEKFSKKKSFGWDTTGGVFSRFNGYVNGIPQYEKTFNVNSAKTINTNKLHKDGGAGLDLSGKGIKLYVWDGGKAFVEHQEFEERVTNLDENIQIWHTSHVAGTIAAKGINSKAKGMAPNAKVVVRDMSFDEDEMNLAANDGLYLSNHSYGSRAGWEYMPADGGWFWLGDLNLSDKEDFKFGWYNDETQLWDLMANEYPFYTIVKAAGNSNKHGDTVTVGDFFYIPKGKFDFVKAKSDQEPFPCNGPYDCIPTHSIAKNIIVVGAVKPVLNYTSPDNVELTWFSSTGPADDGRIKPDIVADGWDVYSVRDRGYNDYGEISGTSMAAPAVTGSIALLEELYTNLYNSKLTSALAKAIIINTARECGNDPGPDYKFGWGLMNTEAAAKAIQNDEIIELIIKDKIEFEVDAKGTKPLKITIAWNDPAHEAMPPALDCRTPMLVNDIDVRVSNDEKTYLPWVLDVENPEKAATKGDNVVDNVEQIVIPNPSGKYTIKLSAKNKIAKGQDVAVVISGVKRDIKVPNAVNVNDIAYKKELKSSFFIENLSADDINLSEITASTNIKILNPPSTLKANQKVKLDFLINSNELGYINQGIKIKYGKKIKTVRVTGFVYTCLPQFADTLDFGTVKYRYSKSLYLTIENIGNDEMKISDIILPKDFHTDSKTALLPKFGSKSFTIKYKPKQNANINEPIILMVDGKKIPVSVIKAKCTDYEVGIENHEKNQFKLYPNPVNNGDCIHFLFAKEKPISVGLFKLTGEKIAEYNASKEMIIQTNDLSRGIVIAKIKFVNKQQSIKIIIR
ncbi:MAG: S8 family serine peptidase [Bacteroidales bacterium]|nr:S8 family serine peptidase [Bacteroidales bacterium]